MNRNILFTFILFSLFLTACHTPSPFKEKMQETMQTSLSWRDNTTGIWETAGWWNSANVLTAVIRFADVTGDMSMIPVIEDVFIKSKKYSLGADSTGVVHYCENYINDYYDDEGWWALAWIEAYKLTGEKKYLDIAEVIFEDMTTGWSDECNGGIYWKKNPLHYKNSIANNLFSLTAIRLYKTTENPIYLNWFNQNVAWYMESGMINIDIYQIEDGTNKECIPNRDQHYTYNQGVAIAVLTEMHLETQEKSYLELAEKIAQATISGRLVNENGILREMTPQVDDSNDGVQLNGIFIRHLAFLYNVTQNPLYKDFILKNAHSIITNNYDPSSKSFGCYWYGPFHKVSSAANSCALECVIEAFELTK